MHPAILLVEDESPARAMPQAILTKAGYAVTEVANGGAALHLLQLNLTRKRPHRLVVLLNLASLAGDVTGFPRASADDAQVAVYHAHVLLFPAECSAVRADAQAGPGLTISALRQSCPPETVRAVVARAASQLSMGVEGAGRGDREATAW
jgi:CheY-like chemotaxis protein